MGIRLLQLEIGHIQTPAPVLHYRNRLSVKILLIEDLLEIGVGVSTDHQVHISGP